MITHRRPASKLVYAVMTAALPAVLVSAQGVAPSPPAASNLPWLNTGLSPEQRADLLIPQMTLEQKVQQLSNDVRPLQDPANRPPGCEFERIARYIQGIPELGIPSVRMTNGGTGLRRRFLPAQPGSHRGPVCIGNRRLVQS